MVGGVPFYEERRYVMTASTVVSIIAVTLSFIFGIISICFSCRNSKRTDTKDIEERVKENTRINMKLDAISTNTTDIKNEVSEMRKEINSHNDRIIKVEESVKSLHHRLDGLEIRINGEKET